MKEGLIKWLGFVLLLFTIAYGFFYIGGVVYCENGNGVVVSGYTCINTDQLIPVLTPEGNTVYTRNITSLGGGLSG